MRIFTIARDKIDSLGFWEILFFVIPQPPPPGSRKHHPGAPAPNPLLKKVMKTFSKVEMSIMKNILKSPSYLDPFARCYRIFLLPGPKGFLEYFIPWLMGLGFRVFKNPKP
jgi:hypothetical protein